MNGMIDISSEMILRSGMMTGALVLVVVLIRMGIHHTLFKASDLPVETQRRWSVNIRNALLLIFILGMISIWAPRLQTFAVSIFAVAVALVLATKELIACLSGTGLRVLTKAYGLGDRIEIGGIRGNVVNHNALTTTVLEIGPGQTSHQYTGRAMIIPNSFIFEHPLTNETYTKQFRLHIITVPLSTDDDWKTAERLLLRAGKEESAPYIIDAEAYFKKLEGKLWLDAPSVEPRITIQLPEPGRINLLLRVPCPTQYPSRMEQAILIKFLSEFHFAPRVALPDPSLAQVSETHASN